MVKSIMSIIALCFLMFGLSLSAQANDKPDFGGSLEAEVKGVTVHFPVLKTDVQADIQGDLVSVKVIQTFLNPTNTPLNATYLFPMNKDSAVYGMTMVVGDEVIEAKIQRKEDAEKIFKEAQKEGKSASLLKQHRPNMFTQSLANLMPNSPIKITISYTQAVPKIDGSYELVVPLVVGPRYQPVGAGVAPDIIDDGKKYGKEVSTSRSNFGAWEVEKLPKYPKVFGLNTPKSIEEDRVSIKVSVNADMPVQNVHSNTHKISVQGEEQSKFISLQKGRVIDNKDFVLRYQLSGMNAQAGFLSVQEARGGFFSLLIEPPTKPEEGDITQREMVFVLDTSGSMGGEPMEASKTFMRHALKNLRSDDYFRIIRFSNNASEFTTSPVRATQSNVEDGLKYVNSLSAGGGTQALNAIDQAFSVSPKKDVLRIVVFLTDGYIGNEQSVLGTISKKIENSRIYAFGVGTSVNRYLLSEMGRAGRGFARFIDPTENSHDAAINLASKLNAPVLTDISINWGDMEVEGITPKIIPDLFAGDSIRIQGKFKGHGEFPVQVNGKVRGRSASMPLQVVLPKENIDVDNNANKMSIPLIWARSQIADNMRYISKLKSVRNGALNDTEMKEKIVSLGLDFSLMTQWTSFVAVSNKVVNDAPEQAKNVSVPLPMVSGVTRHAYSGNGSSGGKSFVDVTSNITTSSSALPNLVTTTAFLVSFLFLILAIIAVKNAVKLTLKERQQPLKTEGKHSKTSKKYFRKSVIYFVIGIIFFFVPVILESMVSTLGRAQ